VIAEYLCLDFGDKQAMLSGLQAIWAYLTDGIEKFLTTAAPYKEVSHLIDVFHKYLEIAHISQGLNLDKLALKLKEFMFLKDILCWTHYVCAISNSLWISGMIRKTIRIISFYNIKVRRIFYEKNFHRE
jgi:hypothetical protein